MASSTTPEAKGKLSVHFPTVTDGKINAKQFVEASSDLVALVEKLGKGFAPVKYDMQGNIDKIIKFYKYDENSCLLELMLEEKNSGKLTAAEGILWLNRALHFFELAFQELIKCLQAKNYDASMKKIFTVAYEGSVKKYHNWVTQQLFTFICKLSPTLSQIMTGLDAHDDLEAFQNNLITFNNKLTSVRCKIEDFHRQNNLFV